VQTKAIFTIGAAPIRILMKQAEDFLAEGEHFDRVLFVRDLLAEFFPARWLIAFHAADDNTSPTFLLFLGAAWIVALVRFWPSSAK
jgi:hypothetical protein